MAKKDQSYDNLGRIMGTGVTSETEPLVDPMAQAEMADGNPVVSQPVVQAPAVAQPTIQQQAPVVPVAPIQAPVAPEVQVNSANNYTLTGNDFNRPEFNKKLTDKATPETGLQFKSNGEVIFARKDKVSRPYIVDILNKAGANLDPNMPYTNDTWNLIRDKYSELHSQGKVIPILEKEGYLTTNTTEPKPSKEQEVQKIVEEAQRTNRSFLDIYKEHIKAPEYEKDRAGRLQGAKRLSLLSDIISIILIFPSFPESFPLTKYHQDIAYQSPKIFFFGILQLLNLGRLLLFRPKLESSFCASLARFLACLRCNCIL